METELLIIKEAVITDITVETKERLFSLLSAPLYKNGFVTSEFVEKVLEREEKFPTGLPIQPIGVAIPHTDPEHVLESSISIGVLEKPVTFQVMASPDETVEVGIVFLLALKDGQKHLSILKKIISFVQNQEMIKRVVKGNKEEVFSLLSDYLSTNEKR